MSFIYSLIIYSYVIGKSISLFYFKKCLITFISYASISSHLLILLKNYAKFNNFFTAFFISLRVKCLLITKLNLLISYTLLILFIYFIVILPFHLQITIFDTALLRYVYYLSVIVPFHFIFLLLTTRCNFNFKNVN